MKSINNQTTLSGFFTEFKFLLCLAQSWVKVKLQLSEQNFLNDSSEQSHKVLVFFPYNPVLFVPWGSSLINFPLNTTKQAGWETELYSTHTAQYISIPVWLWFYPCRFYYDYTWSYSEWLQVRNVSLLMYRMFIGVNCGPASGRWVECPVPF